MSIRFVIPGLSSARRTSRPESVTALLNFFRIASARPAEHRSLRRAASGRHLPLGLLQIHDPRADLREDALGDRERLAVALVEALGDVPRELEMLALVVADRNLVGLVEEDVAGHQSRVREHAGADEILLLPPVLELGHPAQLTEARGRAEQPSRLRMRGDVTLDEDGRAVGVEARCEHGRKVERALAEIVGVVRDRDRVEVDDAEERLARSRGGVLPEAPE